MSLHPTFFSYPKYMDMITAKKFYHLWYIVIDWLSFRFVSLYVSAYVIRSCMHLLLLDFELSYFTLHYITYHIISYHTISYLVISYHIISYHISYYISYHIYMLLQMHLNELKVLYVDSNHNYLNQWLPSSLTHICSTSGRWVKIFIQMNCKYYHSKSLSTQRNSAHEKGSSAPNSTNSYKRMK